MPPRDLRTCLYDALEAGQRIVEVTADKTLGEYRADWVLRAAVERQFEIIGEALMRATRIDPSLMDQISDCRKIIAFRNQVIHGYDVIDHDIVWGIVENYLRALLSDVRSVQESLSD